MPTQFLPRRVLVQLATKLYEANKYCISLSGRDPNKPYVVATEIEPGWALPDDYVRGLNQLKDFIPSLKKLHPNQGEIPRIDLEVDQKNFPQEIIAFIKKSNDLKRFIAKDENNIFWFQGNKRIFPKKQGSDYWTIFETIYDVAMAGTEIGKDFYLAEYKKLKTELGKKSQKFKNKDKEEFMDSIGNFVNLTFRRRPQSFHLPKSSYNKIEIFDFEKGKGVKLYNPEL